jgi:hypothetical protein
MAMVGGIGTMGRDTSTIIAMITGADITATGIIMVRRRTIITSHTIRAPGVDTTVGPISQVAIPNPALDSSLARAEIGDIVTDCEVKENHIR